MTRTERAASSSELFASIDRIDCGLAVLISRDAHMWLVPEEKLPRGASEGDVLRVKLTIDLEATERELDRIRSLQRRLLDRSGD